MQSLERKNSNARGIPLPDSKLYYKAMVVRNYNIGIKNKNIAQCNRI